MSFACEAVHPCLGLLQDLDILLCLKLCNQTSHSSMMMQQIETSLHQNGEGFWPLTQQSYPLGPHIFFRFDPFYFFPIYIESTLEVGLPA